MAKNLDNQLEPVKKFAKKHKLSLPIFWDGDKRTPDSFQVAAMPTTYVINQSGTIVSVMEGYSEEKFAQMTKQVARLLKLK